MHVKGDRELFRAVAEEQGTSLRFDAAGDSSTPIWMVADRFVRRDAARQKHSKWLRLANVKAFAKQQRGTLSFATARLGIRGALTLRWARSL